MITVRRVLCPVDFSEYSQRALRHASAIAERHGAGLTVLHVEDVLLVAARTKVDRYSNGLLAAEDELRAFVGSLVPRRSNLRVIVTSGNPVTNIVEHAKRHSDLIVMGTGGRAGVSRLVLGSVTEGVVARATCPVLTIPPGVRAQPTDARLESHERILCASDFSPSCRLALDMAVSLARPGTRLIVLHVLPFPPAMSTVRTGVAIDRNQLRARARGRLEGGLPADATFRCRPEVVVADGNPAEAILQIAEGENVDLVVMGVTSRGAIDRLVFGSTTRRVMQAARCPVLSVRAGHGAEPWIMWPPRTLGPLDSASA